MHEYNSQDREFRDDINRIEYAHDLSGNLTFLNKAGELITGYSVNEARQMNIAQVVTPEFNQRIEKQVAQMLKRRPGFVFEIEILAKDGKRVALEVSWRLITHAGRLVEIRGIASPR
jgi:PAS domain S-box-containing protein